MLESQAKLRFKTHRIYRENLPHRTHSKNLKDINV